MTKLSEDVPVSTGKVLKLIDYLTASGMAASKKEAFEMIGFNYYNANKLKKGACRFTATQIESICRITGANANWIYGFEESMMRKVSYTPIDQLKEAVAAIEATLKGCDDNEDEASSN